MRIILMLLIINNFYYQAIPFLSIGTYIGVVVLNLMLVSIYLSFIIIPT